MRKVRALVEARIEYFDALRYHRDADPRLAQRFRDDFQAGLAQARRMPASFPLVPALPALGARRFLLDQFEYAVVFDATEEEVVIIAIHHQAKKPGYWRRRLAKVRR